MEDAEVDAMRALTADARSANITLGACCVSILFLSLRPIFSFSFSLSLVLDYYFSTLC